MTTTTDIRNMSIYIPHVFPNINEERIISIFETLRLGKVRHVDFIGKIDQKGIPYNAVYVHFDYWYSTAATLNLQARIANPDQEARIVYDDPWFWVVLENTGKKQVVNGRKQCINLGPSPSIKVELAPTIQIQSSFLQLKPEHSVEIEKIRKTNELQVQYQECQRTYQEYQRAYQEYQTACEKFNASSAAENASSQQQTPSDFTPDVVRTRINEINDIIALHSEQPTRKEVHLLNSISGELSELEAGLQAFDEQENIEQAVTAFVEEQELVAVERFVLDPENENHWLTRAETENLLQQYRNDLANQDENDDDTDFEWIANTISELVQVLSEPDPVFHIDGVAYELLDEMEDAEEQWKNDA